jgi:hypothetical protein
VRTLLFGNAQRRTLGFYDEYEGEPPFAPDGGPAVDEQGRRRVTWTDLSSNNDLTATRNLRVLHVVYARAFVPREPVADGRPQADDAAAIERYLAQRALTLCVLWKELITLAFPGQAKRITVVSPQIQGFGNTASTNERLAYLWRRYGRCIVQGDPLATCTTLPAATMAFLAEKTTRRVDVYIVEDADWDLGVARAILDDPRFSEQLLATTRFESFGRGAARDGRPEIAGFLGYGARSRETSLLMPELLRYLLGTADAAEDEGPRPPGGAP